MRSRTTSDIKSLLIGSIVSLIFIVILGRRLSSKLILEGKITWDNIKTVIIVIFLITIFVLCIKGLLKNYQQYKIKKNKKNMLKIHAKIIGFQPWEKNKYYFIASDGNREFTSEEFVSQLFWLSLGTLESLKHMNIKYDFENPEDAIKSIEDYIQELETGNSSTIEGDNGIKNFLFTTQIPWLPAWINTKVIVKKLLEQILQQLKIGTPYIIVNKHKLSINNEVDVYVDPIHPENYWIDTDFIYS